ncbi:hypothetical protein Patl1_32874 [Pistacia atlantica]|uniref:Uncharacterized protein n=1 Tax=Pistacia atlantica TaxID=434234 RepID=A0ACC1AQB3_9ROSI|nr:hypothetical protein Patl1_32874 [Pistacia atlantica]
MPNSFKECNLRKRLNTSILTTPLSLLSSRSKYFNEETPTRDDKILLLKLLLPKFNSSKLLNLDSLFKPTNIQSFSNE